MIMREVLISIQPKWCELIASGKKTVEVRKTRPKLETPFKCYIYCTNTKPYLAWGDSFRGGSWITDFSALRGYNKKEAERIFELFNGKVIGEFVCDCIANYEAELWDDETYERIQEFFEPDDFAEYGEYEYKTVADNEDDFWRDNRLCNSSCLTIEELRKYVGTGIATFYGWQISDLVIYDKPKELSEFVTHCKYEFDDDFEHCEGCQFYCYSNTPSCGIEEYCGCDGLKPIKRPPQSWCYVELLKGAENNG